MSGNVTPFLDYKNLTDDGLNAATAIQPLANGEQINQTVLQRPDENLRQRTEAVRSFVTDSLFLHNADRSFLLVGPGNVTWPGSTTVAQTGRPVLSDVLWIIPMLTPGSAQVQPIPPVASAFGTLHLKRASDNMNSILVTSQRRSYAAGDQINIEVSAGGAFSCTLQTEVTGAYRRTIKIVATPTTTLSTVITALNGITPPAPDNTQLVTAALEGGAVNGDFILDTQARQFVAGNYDGEGHTITPANLASFFTSNPSESLAEGDTLCVQFAMLNDTASTGGRRQAIPENSNTTITAGMFFNSRVHPSKLVNALPICKVVNGALVFATGVEIPAGSTAVSLSPRGASNLLYAGGPTWADGTTNPATTVEAQLDKIVTDLSTGSGAAKIAYGGGGAWSDGTTNPAATVEAQLDKVITDLSGTGGGAKIGGAAVGGGAVLAAANLNTQIADLATNWGKKSSANTWTLTQTFAAIIATTVTASDVVQGTALKYTVPATRYIHPTKWTDNATATSFTTHTRGYGSAILGASATPIYCPIEIRDDETITQYRVSVQKNDTSNQITTQIVSVSDAGEVGESAGALSGISAGPIAMDESGLNLTGSGKRYYVKITPGGTIIPSADRILFVRFLAKCV